jgi:large repetitive protein
MPQRLFPLFLLLLKAVSGSGQPLAVTVINVSNTTCQYNNGSFVVKATGGTSPYVYASSAARQSNTTGIFAELVAGSYDILVTDAAGSKINSSVTLTNQYSLPNPGAITKSDPTGCLTNDGQITVTPSGGTPPYQFSLDDGVTYQGSNVLSNVAPGLYTIYVKDANGCVTTPWSAINGSYINHNDEDYSKGITLQNPNCGLQFNTWTTVLVCEPENSIQVSGVTKGTPPYAYSIDGGPFSASNGGQFIGLYSGVHTVSVKDASGLVNTFTWPRATIPLSAKTSTE